VAIDWNKPQPAPKALWKLVYTNFPSTRFLGIYNNRNVRGGNTPSAHADGRALDIGLLATRPDEKEIGDGLFKIFIDNATELGIEHAIWNRQIWSTAKGGPRNYSGASPHTDHIHVAFSRTSSQTTNFPKTSFAIAVFRGGLADLEKYRRTVG
jgi:hypothetical protein